jgi:hypothetical protein
MRTLLLIPAALAAGGCGPLSTSGPADARLAAFIPGDTVMLAGIHVAELKKTPLYRQVIAMLGSVERQGFDPRRDVDELLVASNGKESVAIGRGRFDGKELQGLERFEHRGVTLYGNEQGAVAIIDPSTALAGWTPAVRAAIDQRNSGGRAAAGLLARARALPTPNHIWMVSNGAPVLPRFPNVPNAEILRKILNNLSNVAFFADLREGIYASATAQCATAGDAKFIGDTVRGLIGLGRLSVPREEPELAKAFDGVAVRQSQRTVTVDAKIPEGVAMAAMERLRSFSEGSRRQESMPRPR